MQIKKSIIIFLKINKLLNIIKKENIKLLNQNKNNASFCFCKRIT